MQRVGQSWLVLMVLTQNDALAVGIVTGLQFLPVLLVGPYAGVVADRFPVRRVLAVTQALMGLLALGLGLLDVSGLVELWHVYLFATLLGTVAAFDSPARQIFVSELVEVEDLQNAVALNATSFNMARLIGPAVAGFGIAAVGTGWLFIANAVTFGATILALALMRREELHELPHSPRAKGQVRAGLAYIRGRTDIVVVMVVIGVVSALGLNFQLTSAVMATTVFGRGAEEYGVVGSLLAIGNLAGALLAARRQRPRVRLVIGAAFAFGVASGVAALAPSFWFYAVSSVFVGWAALTMMTAANATVQLATEPAMRGRVMAIYMMVFLGSTPIGSPFVGWVAGAWGPRWSLGVGAIASILVAALAAVWVRRAWRMQVEYHAAVRPRLQIIGPAERHQLELARKAALVEDATARLAAEDAERQSGSA